MDSTAPAPAPKTVGAFIAKVIDTMHRLADSRKAIATVGANIIAATPFVLKWLAMIPNWNQAATDAFTGDAKVLAAIFTGSAAWLTKMIADEDAARAAAAAVADISAGAAPAPAAPPAAAGEGK